MVSSRILVAALLLAVAAIASGQAIRTCTSLGVNVFEVRFGTFCSNFCFL